MTDALTEQGCPTDRRHFWRRVLIVVGLIVVCSQWVRVVRHPTGDFGLHWEFGRRLAAGEPLYGDWGLDRPYLPFWAVVHAPLTMFPKPVAQAITLPLFLVAFVGLVSVLHRLAERRLPADRDAEFWIVAIAVLLAGRFLIRDVLESGVNLALVALAWASVWLWSKKRDVAAGACLGFAIALKLTPALFLAWFAWKRQWKVAAATVAVTAMCVFSPLCFMDVPSYIDAHAYWTKHAVKGFSASDPTTGVLGAEPLQNMALRPALGRFLMHLPEKHDARLDHPLYVDFLNLTPAQAGWVTRLAMLAILCAVAWRFRHPVTDRRDPQLLWEAATVSVLILLFSPLTWGQHCVGVFPAFYLLLRSHWRQPMPSGTKAFLAVYVFCILALNRAVIGKAGTYLVDSYRVSTWCLLGLAALVALRRTDVPSMATDRHAALSPKWGWSTATQHDTST